MKPHYSDPSNELNKQEAGNNCEEEASLFGIDGHKGRGNDESKKTDDAEEVDDVQEKTLEVAQPKPPDGGYGWFVVLGCFISHVVFAGLDRSEGVFFLLLTAQFEQSAQLSSWPGAVVCTLQLILGPVANAVSSRFSVRFAVALGGAFMSIGLILSSFAPNIYLYFIAHAFIDGVGRGLSYVPGLYIVGTYFDKRVSLAAGVATAGSGCGTFVIVPLSQYLAENFGFQGTFLILAGFACHIFISAMLYRPLSVHFKLTEASKRRKMATVVCHKDSDDVGENIMLQHPGISSPGQTAHAHCIITTNSTWTPSSEPTKGKNKHNKQEDKRSCLTSSFKTWCPAEPMKTTSGNVFHLDLLRNPPFLMYCLSIFLFTMAFRAAFTFLPALIESKGISKSEAALALSAAGAVDTFGRITVGFLLDLPKLRPVRLLLYNLVILGVALAAFVLPSLGDFATFCVVSGVYGLMTGAYISQKSVVLADILDAQHLAGSLGILMVFQGLGGLLGPPLSGALKDFMGTFDESFYLGGGLLIISGLLMALCNIFNFLQKRKLHPMK